MRGSVSQETCRFALDDATVDRRSLWILCPFDPPAEAGLFFKEDMMTHKKTFLSRALLAVLILLLALMYMIPTSVHATGPKYKDGTYEAALTCTGGSGKGGAKQAQIIVQEGAITTLTVTMSSAKYDYAKVDGAADKVMADTSSGKSVFTFPYPGKETFEFIANTTAMGTPHEITYTLTVTPKDPIPQEAPAPKVLHSDESVSLDPGKYEAIDPEAITAGNKMFRGIKALLTVNEDKSCDLDLYLSGTGYDALYMGEKLKDMPEGIITKNNENGLWTSKELPLSEAAQAQDGMVNGEQKKHFALHMPSLYTQMALGAHSQKYDQWSMKKLNFSADNFKALTDQPSVNPELSDDPNQPGGNQPAPDTKPDVKPEPKSGKAPNTGDMSPAYVILLLASAAGFALAEKKHAA